MRLLIMVKGFPHSADDSLWCFWIALHLLIVISVEEVKVYSGCEMSTEISNWFVSDIERMLSADCCLHFEIYSSLMLVITLSYYW